MLVGAEAFARDYCNMRFMQQPLCQLGWGLHFGAEESRNIRIDVERAVRTIALDARNSLQAGQYVITKLNVLGTHFCHAFLWASERRDRCFLCHGRRT